MNKIISSTFHTAVITSEGRVVCWGNNKAGQCNPPADLENVVQVCCGTSHTAALTADGQVVCWGDNNYYQCDVPERFAQKNPGVVHVAGSYNTVSIITSDGCVVCWGNNDAGQCNPPADLTNVVSIYVGYHIAAVTTDGRVVCWGDNEYGQCNVPSDLLPVVSVHCSDYRTYAITSDGMVTYWGNQDEYTTAFVPPSFLREQNIKISNLICTDYYTTIAITADDGRIICWGDAYDYGEDQSEVPQITNVIVAGSTRYGNVALTADGQFVWWGNASTEFSHTQDDAQIMHICVGREHVTAILSDGRVICAGSGYNSHGECDVPDGLVAAGCVILL